MVLLKTLADCRERRATKKLWLRRRPPRHFHRATSTAAGASQGFFFHGRRSHRFVSIRPILHRGVLSRVESSKLPSFCALAPFSSSAQKKQVTHAEVRRIVESEIGCAKEGAYGDLSSTTVEWPSLGYPIPRLFLIMAAARIPQKMGPLSYWILAGSGRRSSSSSSAAAGESRTQKLERIADELLSLNKIERHDYNILYRLKLGLDRWGSAAAIAGPGMSGNGAATEGGQAEAVEKTAFDVKLEKFDAATKIKVIKEVRTFTELGLKEAKEMVEKAPIVLKKGVTKEEAEQILAKLKAAGATAVLE